MMIRWILAGFAFYKLIQANPLEAARVRYLEWRAVAEHKLSNLLTTGDDPELAEHVRLELVRAAELFEQAISTGDVAGIRRASAVLEAASVAH